MDIAFFVLKGFLLCSCDKIRRQLWRMTAQSKPDIAKQDARDGPRETGATYKTKTPTQGETESSSLGGAATLFFSQ